MASCCTHARMHDAARAARVAAGARRAGPCMHAHMCTDVRATVGCAHGYLGLPACMACMRVSGTLCLSCVRAQRAGTNTQTHTYAHMRSISREGGGDHSLTAAALRVAQPDGFFRMPAHTYHTRAGSITLTWQVRAHVHPALRGSTSLIQVRGQLYLFRCRGSQSHPAARMRASMMQREWQGPPRARAGQGRVCTHTCVQMCELL